MFLYLYYNHAHRLRLEKPLYLELEISRSSVDSRFKLVPSTAKSPGSETEIIPVKDSHAIIKPSNFARGHSSYITVTVTVHPNGRLCPHST
jgi:hypothetical protein